MKRVLY